MKTIRRNCFETNSSSTHSLCISEEGKYSSISLNEDGNIILNGGKFGWGWDKFNDPLTKANYCVVDNQYNFNRIEFLKNVIKEQTGANEVIIDISDNYNFPNYSYIDHEGHGTTQELFSSEEKLKNFIFNENSWLYIGNDNETPPNKFYDSSDQKYPYTIEIWDKDFKVTSWDLKEEFPKDEDSIINLFYEIFNKIRYNASINKWEYNSYNWSLSTKYFEFSVPWNEYDVNNYFNIEEKYVCLITDKFSDNPKEFLKLSINIIENEIIK